MSLCTTETKIIDDDIDDIHVIIFHHHLLSQHCYQKLLITHVIQYKNNKISSRTVNVKCKKFVQWSESHQFFVTLKKYKMHIPYMRVAIYALTFLTYAYSGYGSNVISSLRDAIIAAEAVFGDVFKAYFKWWSESMRNFNHFLIWTLECNTFGQEIPIGTRNIWRCRGWELCIHLSWRYTIRIA